MDQVEEKKRTNLKIRAASFRSRELVEMGGKEHRRGGRGLTGRIATICRDLELRDLELLLRCPTDSQEPPSPPPHFTMPFHQTPHIAGADCTSEALGTRWWGAQRKGGWVGNRKKAQFV